MKIIRLTIFSIIFSWIYCAQAGLYIGGLGGVLLTKDLAINKSNLAPSLPPEVKIDYKPGYKLGLFAGMRFPLFRLELEGSRSHSEAKQAIVNGTAMPLSGSVTSYTLMANGLLAIPGIVSPYAGGGIGYISVHNSISNNLKDSVLGYQFIAGASVGLSILNVFVDYRYIGSSHATSLNKAYSNHTLNAGVFLEIA